MILLLVNAHQKKIAFALLMVFSLSLLDSVAIAARPVTRYYQQRVESRKTLAGPFNLDTNILDRANAVIQTEDIRYLQE